MKQTAQAFLRFLRRLVSGKETISPKSAAPKFAYGWFCPKCNRLTEHKIAYREHERCLICQECDLATSFPVRRPSVTPPVPLATVNRRDRRLLHGD